MEFYTDVKKTLDNIVKKQNDDMIIRWDGLLEIENLYLIYLLNKYKSKCLIKTTAFNKSRGLVFINMNNFIKFLKLFGFKPLYEIENRISYEVADELVDCIKNKDIETIIIPLSIIDLKRHAGHANVLIYRKKMSVIEHFEPHGNNGIYQDVIKTKMEYFITTLNNKLTSQNLPNVELISASNVCPYIGPQRLEAVIPNKKLNDGRLETGGYCVVWSLLFTELALKYPLCSSNTLVRFIIQAANDSSSDLKGQFQYITSSMRSIYLKNLMRGYVKKISEKLEKYFNPFFDDNFNIFKSMVSTTFNVQNMTGEEINSTKFQCYVNAFINIEHMKLNPIFDKDKYIETLDFDIRTLKNEQTLKKYTNNEDKIHCIEFEKSIIEKMDLLNKIGKSVSKSRDDEKYQSQENQVLSVEPTSVSAKSSRSTIKSRSDQSQVVNPTSVTPKSSRSTIKSRSDQNRVVNPTSNISANSLRSSRTRDIDQSINRYTINNRRYGKITRRRRRIRHLHRHRHRPYGF